MDNLLTWELIRYGAPVLGIIVMLVATVKIHNIKSKNERMEKAISATSGMIVPPKIDTGISQIVTVSFGTNNLNVAKGFITNGKSFNPLGGLGCDLPLSFTLDQSGALMVSASFRDYNESTVAEISNNEWQINPNNYFKRNYDSQGFEVIDKEGLTKFQVEFIDGEKIKIGGVFRDTYNWWFVNDTTVYMTDVKLLKKEDIIKESERVPDMFQYPEDKYFGVRKIDK